MRVHKDGYIQCRQVTLWMPLESYQRAIQCGRYLSEGLRKEIELLLNVELYGELRFRKVGNNEDMILIQIDSDWVQPTRS